MTHKGCGRSHSSRAPLGFKSRKSAVPSSCSDGARGIVMALKAATTASLCPRVVPAEWCCWVLKAANRLFHPSPFVCLLLIYWHPTLPPCQREGYAFTYYYLTLAPPLPAFAPAVFDGRPSRCECPHLPLFGFGTRHIPIHTPMKRIFLSIASALFALGAAAQAAAPRPVSSHIVTLPKGQQADQVPQSSRISSDQR